MTQLDQLRSLETALLQCITEMSKPKNKTGLYCPATFDDIMCWPDTIAGTEAKQLCPAYFHGFNRSGYAVKKCLPSGEWYVHPVQNTTYTNFTGCIPKQQPNLTAKGSTVHELTSVELAKLHLKRMQFIYRIGYSLSLIFLVVATITMVSLRKLRCQRNTIHLNLFLSFILRCIVCFLKDEYGIPEGETNVMVDTMKQLSSSEASWKCKLLYTIFFYILMANYMWVFAEGIYLHSLIFVAFHTISSRTFKILVSVVWASPVVCIVPWVITRIKYEDTLCWNLHDQNLGFQWIIEAPIMLTLFINFLFFLNIVRVLFTKLSATHSRDPKCYRKLAKSTLVLIPLFGVHFVVFNAIPICLEPNIEIIWMYLELTISSFQGFIVSLLFCFFNGEVKTEIRKHWRMRTLRRQSLVSSRSTRAFSIQSSEQDSPKSRDKRDSSMTHIRENLSIQSLDNKHNKSSNEDFKNNLMVNREASELSYNVKDDNENDAFLPTQKVTFF